jgi:hypothetical protein
MEEGRGVRIGRRICDAVFLERVGRATAVIESM